MSGDGVVLRVVGGACVAGRILAGACPAGGVRVRPGRPVLQFAERGPVHLHARGRRLPADWTVGVFQRVRRCQLVDAGRAGNRRTELGAGATGRLHDRGHVVCVRTTGERQQGHSGGRRLRPGSPHPGRDHRRRRRLDRLGIARPEQVPFADTGAAWLGSGGADAGHRPGDAGRVHRAKTTGTSGLRSLRTRRRCIFDCPSPRRRSTPARP